MNALLAARELLATRRLLTIAHRGASHVAPENTLPAFQAALELGVDLVELDYQHTADDVPVVFHDDELDRTTDAALRWAQTHVRLDSKSLPELQTLDAGSWFSPQFTGTRIATLREALELITRQSIALVERKTGSADVCARLLSGNNLVERVVVQAFDWGFLAECRRRLPDLSLAALGEKQLTTAALDEVVRLKIPVVGWEHEYLTPELILAAHDRGLSLWAWTVDEPRRMRELADWGVRGIITNRPDLLLAIRGEAAHRPQSESGL